MRGVVATVVVVVDLSIYNLHLWLIFHLTYFHSLFQRQEEAKARAAAELASLNEDVLKCFGDAPLIQSQTISNKVNRSYIPAHNNYA